MNQFVEMQDDRGDLILGLGIGSIALATLGFMCCGPLGIAGAFMGIAAAVMGYQDLASMKNGSMNSRGQGNTTGGMICGIIGGVIGLLLGLLFVGIMIMYGALLAGAGADSAPF